MFIGAAAILDVWGIEIGPVLAGLGLFGLAGALAAQDLLKNLLSGVLILAERRFHVGDWIRVEGVVEGTVETIGFRSTAVRQFDKALVQVPNTSLADNAVINFSRMTHRRIYWKIGVVYGTSVEQLRYIRDEIERYVLESDDFAKPPEVSTFVRIDSFGPSSIDIMLYCFTKTTVWGEWLGVKEQLAYRIKDIVAEAKSSFAFPSTSIYLESMPVDAPEIFEPPAGYKPGSGAAIVESSGSTAADAADGDGG
jgi:MscS family membrane protein